MDSFKKIAFAILLIFVSFALVNCGGSKEYEVSFWTNFIKARGVNKDYQVFLNGTGKGTHKGKLVMNIGQMNRGKTRYEIPFQYTVTRKGDVKKIHANYSGDKASIRNLPGSHHPNASSYTWKVNFSGEFAPSNKKSEFYNSYKSSGINDRGEIIFLDKLGATLSEFKGKTRVSKQPLYMYSTHGGKLTLAAKR